MSAALNVDETTIEDDYIYSSILIFDSSECVGTYGLRANVICVCLLCFCACGTVNWVKTCEMACGCERRGFVCVCVCVGI